VRRSAKVHTKDSFAFQQAGFPESKTAAEALTRGDYVEFTVTPKPGTSVSITSLTFVPYWQAPEQAAPGGGIAYSIAGGPFNVTTQTGDPSRPSPLTATFSGVPALQNLTGPVTFRLLQPNLGEYSFAGIGRNPGDDIVVLGSVATVPE